MKKLILLFISIFLFISCTINSVHKPKVENPEVKITDNVISIKSGSRYYDYEKIKIDNHDFYFRTWSTKYGCGSDLVHNPNCKSCKNID